MSNSPATESGPSMCEVLGCSSPATTTRWSMDEDRRIHVCWKHAEDEPSPPESG